ncbi:MAG: DUF1264 domain-containing protein [Candidatus Acidiferrales bacterium]
MRMFLRMGLAFMLASVACSPLAAQTDAKTPTKETQESKSVGQSRIPVEQLQIYVDGFHNSKRDADLPAEKQMQMRVTHYCQALNEDLIQCVVYDGNTKAAHLIGIEHIISDKVFQTLPDTEKKYWHPHDGEVDSGMLDLPGMSDDQKKGVLQMIRSTHGKTWHVWDTHKDSIPMGTPTLMWAIDPGKMNAQTKSGMDKRKENPTF